MLIRNHNNPLSSKFMHIFKLPLLLLVIFAFSPAFAEQSPSLYLLCQGKLFNAEKKQLDLTMELALSTEGIPSARVERSSWLREATLLALEITPRSYFIGRVSLKDNLSMTIDRQSGVARGTLRQSGNSNLDLSFNMNCERKAIQDIPPAKF